MLWFYTDLIVAFIVLLASFVAHEAGHIMKAEKLGYKTKTGWKGLNFEVKYWPNVTVSDNIKVLESGIFFGFAISLLSVLLTIFWSPLVIVCYAVGCGYDFKRLRYLYQEKRDKAKSLNIRRT